MHCIREAFALTLYVENPTFDASLETTEQTTRLAETMASMGAAHCFRKDIDTMASSPLGDRPGGTIALLWQRATPKMNPVSVWCVLPAASLS